MLSLYLSMVETDEQSSFIEQLFSDYEQIMFRTAFAVLHNDEDAEDAVHEAFLRIIPNIDKITGIAPPRRKSYIVITTRNIAIDHYRSDMKQVDIGDCDVKDDDEDVERDVFSQYDCETLNSAISRLTDKLRQVLILYYYHEETTDNIAQILGISAVAVRTRLLRARKALYDILTEGENDDV